MSVRTKMMLSLAAVAFLAVIAGGITRRTLIRQFEAMEREQVEACMNRVWHAMDESLTELRRTGYDWAEWDDTNEFVAGERPEYVQDNLGPAVLVNLALDFMVFLDSEGVLVYADSVKPTTGEPSPLDDGLWRYVSEHPQFTEFSGNPDAKTGFIPIGSGRYAVVIALPITDTGGGSRSNGILIQGYELDTRYIQHLEASSSSSIELASFGSSKNPPADALSIRTESSEVVAGAAVVNDILGEPAAVLTVRMPRDIYRRGMANLRVIIIQSVALSILALAALYWAIQTIVLRPVGKIANFVRAVADRPLAEEEISLDSSDEFGALAGELMSMTVRLRESRTSLEIANQQLDQKIEHQHAALKAASESETRFRLLAENLPGVVYLCRNDARYTMLYLNEAAEALTGYPVSEFLANRKSFVDLYHPDDRDAIFREVNARIAARQPFHMRYRLIDKSGGAHYVEEFGCGVWDDETGGLMHLEGFICDVTERQNLEGQLRQRRKLEALGTLSGGIAHDFNNILTAILGYTDLALDRYGKDPSLAAALSQIRAASVRAAELVRRILLFSRNTPPTLSDVRLQDVVGEAAMLLRGSISSMIDIDVDIEEECGAVRGDSAQIHQVLMNLATNAMQSFPNGKGRIGIRLASVNSAGNEGLPEGLAAGSYACIEVSDNGAGMEGHTVSRIFDPYFTTKEAGKGSGLGLSTVHGIVASHGGAIDVRSAPGEGSTFRVYLPISNGEVRATRPIATAPPSFPRPSPSRILFVDDEPEVLRVGVELLRRLGHDVSGYSDPEHALAAFERNPDGYDAAITDLSMPGLSGIELAGRLHRLRPSLPIVLCSGYFEDGAALKRNGTGIAECLMKPASAAEMTAALARAVARSAIEATMR